MMFQRSHFSQMIALATGGLKLLVAGFVLQCACSLNAEQPKRSLNWAEKMFSELEYDFEVVASGAKIEHAIEVKNIYKEEIKFEVPWRSNCATVTPTLDESVLASKQTSLLKLRMDTDHFRGQRSHTMIGTASFNGNNSRQVRIPINAYIREDIHVSSPPVAEGQTPSLTNRCLRVSYQGNPNWAIREVISDDPEVTILFKEIDHKDGDVTYDIRIQRPGSPPPADEYKITIETNEPVRQFVVIECVCHGEPSAR